MTRYARYKKQFNTSTISDERLSKEEERHIELSKAQSVDALRASHNFRSKPVCLKCRRRGHQVKYCPSGIESICYNCGSRDHTLKHCRKPRTAELPFASCFICKLQGHLASQCSQNQHGIYPKGGGCRFCGSKEHLARDCRPTRQAQQGSFVGASVDPKMENPDEDLMYSSLSKIQGEKDAKRERRPTEEKSDKKQVKKAKIVTF